MTELGQFEDALNTYGSDGGLHGCGRLSQRLGSPFILGVPVRLGRWMRGRNV